MSASFQIDVDVTSSLVRMTMGGLFEPADIQRFLVARDAAHLRLLCGPNEHLTLNDLREMKIQPQAAVAGFQKLLASPRHRSRRLAFVTGPTLARTQLQRALAGRTDTRCFGEVAPAERWLLEDVPAIEPLRRIG